MHTRPETNLAGLAVSELSIAVAERPNDLDDLEFDYLVSIDEDEDWDAEAEADDEAVDADSDQERIASPETEIDRSTAVFELNDAGEFMSQPQADAEGEQPTLKLSDFYAEGSETYEAILALAEGESFIAENHGEDEQGQPVKWVNTYTRNGNRIEISFVTIALYEVIEEAEESVVEEIAATTDETNDDWPTETELDSIQGETYFSEALIEATNEAPTGSIDPTGSEDSKIDETVEANEEDIQESADEPIIFQAEDDDADDSGWTVSTIVAAQIAPVTPASISPTPVPVMATATIAAEPTPPAQPELQTATLVSPTLEYPRLPVMEQASTPPNLAEPLSAFEAPIVTDIAEPAQPATTLQLGETVYLRASQQPDAPAPTPTGGEPANSLVAPDRPAEVATPVIEAAAPSGVIEAPATPMIESSAAPVVEATIVPVAPATETVVAPAVETSIMPVAEATKTEAPAIVHEVPAIAHEAPVQAEPTIIAITAESRTTQVEPQTTPAELQVAPAETQTVQAEATVTQPEIAQPMTESAPAIAESIDHAPMIQTATVQAAVETTSWLDDLAEFGGIAEVQPIPRSAETTSTLLASNQSEAPHAFSQAPAGSSLWSNADEGFEINIEASASTSRRRPQANRKLEASRS